MKTAVLMFFVAITAGTVVISGCRSEQNGASAQPLPRVTVALPVQTDVVDYAEFTGRTEAVDTVELRARVQGFLQSVNFTEGRMVEKDALLFVIEPEPFQARLDAAEAAREQTKAAVKLAQANFNRAKKLIASKAISVEEYQTNAAQLEAAKAQLLKNEADVEQATINFRYTKIRAPFHGLIGRSLVDPGNLVGAAESTLLTTIVQVDPMHAYFDVPERTVLEVLKWRRDQKDEVRDEERKPTVFLGLTNEEGYPHEGELDFLENRVDPTTGTALVRGVFPNEGGLLYSGLFVRLRIPGETQTDALLVREEALATDLGGKYLLVVGDENVVQQRHVELGTLVDGMRVVRKGLAADEKYIVEGLQRARPGLPVDPQMAEEDEEPRGLSLRQDGTGINPVAR